MKISSFIFLLFLFLSSMGAHAAISANSETVTSDSIKLRGALYDGKWSGSIKCLYDPGLWPEDECDFGLSLEIFGDSFSVKYAVRSKSGKESWSDVKPGKFQLVTLAANAIAVSITAGNDEDGTWVETWSFAMTLIDPDHMLVHWTRVVNNLDMPKNEKASKFSSVGMGELTRLSATGAER